MLKESVRNKLRREPRSGGTNVKTISEKQIEEGSLDQGEQMLKRIIEKQIEEGA